MYTNTVKIITSPPPMLLRLRRDRNMNTSRKRAEKIEDRRHAKFPFPVKEYGPLRSTSTPSPPLKKE